MSKIAKGLFWGFIGVAAVRGCTSPEHYDPNESVGQRTARELSGQAVKLGKEKGPVVAKGAWDLMQSFGKGVMNTLDKEIPRYDENGQQIEP